MRTHKTCQSIVVTHIYLWMRFCLDGSILEMPIKPWLSMTFHLWMC